MKNQHARILNGCGMKRNEDGYYSAGMGRGEVPSEECQGVLRGLLVEESEVRRARVRPKRPHQLPHQLAL